MKQEAHELGDSVICDLCGTDFTGSDEKGGFLFGSKAVCPRCAINFEKTVIKYGETHYITQRAAPNQTFVDFVINDLRKGKPAEVVVTTFDNLDEIIDSIK